MNEPHPMARRRSVLRPRWFETGDLATQIEDFSRGMEGRILNVQFFIGNNKQMAVVWYWEDLS